MTKVITSEDCGNSPKNIFVQDLTIAFANADISFILKSVTDDILWNIVGDTRIEGKESLVKSLEQLQNNKAAELTVLHVATHGKAGAVNGTAKFETEKTVAFCNVYEFSNAKGTSVVEITSYEIEIK